MSAHANRLAPILLLVVSIWMGSLITAQHDTCQLPYHTLKQTERIMNIRSKLEGFVKDTVSYDELKEAFEEYNKWPENEKKALRSIPHIRLVIDFALAPMQLQDPPMLSEIQRNYALYSRAYIRGKSVSTDHRLLVGSTAIVINKLCRINKAPLVYEELVAAKDDSLRHLERMNKLSEEGLIYKNLKEFERIVNFFTHPLTRSVFTDVFPAMKYLNDIEALELIYSESTMIAGYTCIDGKFKDIYPWTLKPGFFHVL